MESLTLLAASATMLAVPEKCKKRNPTDPGNPQNQVYVQLVLSLLLGVAAFLAFCLLRPRWPGLYAARKTRLGDQDGAELDNERARLPDLPNTFFGWVPVLYHVTEEQVLASAGLDAHVVCLASVTLSIVLTRAVLGVFQNVHEIIWHHVSTNGCHSCPYQ